jgi:hypothetical protein
MYARGGGGGGGTTIVINPEDLRQTSTIALEVGQAFHALAGQLGARPLPEMPPAIAARVSTELSEVCCLLNSEPQLLLETAQELRARAFWAEVADRLAAGNDLEGAQLAEFKAGMASGILQRYATEWEKELGRNYAKEVHDRENPGGIGGFFKDVGGGIADFATGAFDSIKDPVVMLYHLTPLHDEWTKQWGALGSGLAHGVTHPLEFGRAVLALDALDERGLAYWLGNLAPAAAATVLSGGAAAGARGAAATERVAAGAKAADRLADLSRLGRTAERTFWKEIADFDGTRVYRRDDLIDPNAVDKLGRSNMDRMAKGLAPLGPDGKPVNLHHTLQTDGGPIAELSQTFHKTNHRVIHINPSSIPSGIDRHAFDAWRARYWIDRARGLAEDP